MVENRALLRMLPRIEHCGFSVKKDGTVACLRREGEERSLILIPRSLPPQVLIHQRSLSRDESKKDPIRPPVWDPSGEKLAFSLDGVWVIRRDGSELEKITDRRVWMPDGGQTAQGGTNLYTEKNAYLTWMPDGKSILFASVSKPDHVALWQVAADGSWSRRLLDARTIQSFAVSPSGGRLAVVTSDGVKGGLWLVHLNGQQVQREELKLGDHRQGHIYRYPKVVWGTDEDTLILRAAGTGWSHFYRRSIETDETVALTDGEWEDGELVLSPDGTRAVLNSRRGSPFDERLWLLDLESLAWEHLAPRLEQRTESEIDEDEVTLEDGAATPVAWIEDALYFTYSSPNRRGDLYVYVHNF